MPEASSLHRGFAGPGVLLARIPPLISLAPPVPLLSQMMMMESEPLGDIPLHSAACGPTSAPGVDPHAQPLNALMCELEPPETSTRNRNELKDEPASLDGDQKRSSWQLQRYEPAPKLYCSGTNHRRLSPWLTPRPVQMSSTFKPARTCSKLSL